MILTENSTYRDGESLGTQTMEIYTGRCIIKFSNSFRFRLPSLTDMTMFIIALMLAISHDLVLPVNLASRVILPSPPSPTSPLQLSAT